MKRRIKKTLSNLIYSLIQLGAYLLSFICNSRIIHYVTYFIAYLRWYGIRQKFASVGKDTLVKFPASVFNPQNIVLGVRVKAESGFIVETFNEFEGQIFSPRIVIGDDVSFGYDCHIGCVNKITIGNNVLVASRVYISDHSHGDISANELATTPVKRKLFSKGPVIIEENVWLGEGVVVMPNVKIGRNSIVGANSVVTHDVPPNCVVAGTPARLIKTLN